MENQQLPDSHPRPSFPNGIPALMGDHNGPGVTVLTTKTCAEGQLADGDRLDGPGPLTPSTLRFALLFHSAQDTNGMAVAPAAT